MKKIKFININIMFIIGILINILGNFISLIIPLQVRKFIDVKKLLENNNIKIIISVAVLLLISSSLLNTLGSFILSREGDKSVYKIRSQLQNHIIKLPLSFFDNEESGNLASHVINDSYVIKNFMTNTVPDFISSLILIFGTMFFVIVLDWRLTFLIFLLVPLVFLLILPLGKITEKLSWKTQEEISNLNGNTAESFRNIRSIKLNTSERKVVSDFKDILYRIYKISLKGDLISSFISPIQQLIAISLILVIIAYGGIRVSSGTLSMGTLVSIILYLFQIMPSFNSLLIFYSNYKQVKGAIKQLDSIISVNPENIIYNSNEEYDFVNKSLYLRNAYFSYDSKPILNGLDLDFITNNKIAIVGPSGAGKTTIINILTRLYNLDNGSLFIGKNDSKDIPIKVWRDLFSVVTQENSIVSGTIRDNITVGSDYQVSDEDIKKALYSAHLLDYVENLPNKLETLVGENGKHLSGGQRQRMQIARAYIRKSKFLIFDEATSNLDANSESYISKAIDNISKSKTVIMIAHRLSTIANADVIYFISNGELLGSGSHDTLQKDLPEYRLFVKEQLLGKNERID